MNEGISDAEYFKRLGDDLAQRIKDRLFQLRDHRDREARREDD